MIARLSARRTWVAIHVIARLSARRTWIATAVGTWIATVIGTRIARLSAGGTWIATVIGTWIARLSARGTWIATADRHADSLSQHANKGYPDSYHRAPQNAIATG